MTGEAVTDLNVARLHKAIREAALSKLGRALTESESRFISSRRGLIALEMILDTVQATSAQEVEAFLNSD